MAQIVKKFITNNAVDETKIRLNNNSYLRARNAADNADVNIARVNASDRIEFPTVPQVGSDAVSSNDLVRYSQLITLIDGIKPKTAVRVATTTAGTLATSFANGQTVDGVTLVTGDRILIKDQVTTSQNGIYVVQSSGAPVRATDYDTGTEISGSYTVAFAGTVNQGTLFVCTSTVTTVGTDPIVFASRSIQTYTAGDMLTLSGSDFSVDLALTSGLESTNPGNAAGQLRVKLEASNPTLQIDGSNQLGIKINSTGAVETSSGGLRVKVDSSTVKINGSNNLETLKPNVEQITLNSTDITNQYVDLAFPAFSAASISLVVLGGIMQNRGVDYTVSLTGGVSGVTRITFAGDLATAGNAALVSGDILSISYLYL